MITGRDRLIDRYMVIDHWQAQQNDNSRISLLNKPEYLSSTNASCQKSFSRETINLWKVVPSAFVPYITGIITNVKRFIYQRFILCVWSKVNSKVINYFYLLCYDTFIIENIRVKKYLLCNYKLCLLWGQMWCRGSLITLEYFIWFVPSNWVTFIA